MLNNSSHRRFHSEAPGLRKYLPFGDLSPKRKPLVALNTRSIALLSFCLAGALTAHGQSMGPYESAADFAKYAMKLREQALLKVEPQVFVPTTSRTSMTRFPWKTNIVTTVFWIGEAAGGNNPVPNVKSSWDANWTSNYGGFDTPDAGARRNYIPVAFVPR